MQSRADKDGSDILLIDTGDRVEGNGLYDGSDPKGEYYFDVLEKQKIDLICSGNHELYLANASNNEFYKTVPAFKENYVASNLDIYNPETGKLEPLAPRFRKFATKNQGIRILAFGFLFDFTGNANNTVVTPVETTVKQDWFQQAIRDRDVDLIVVFGHVAIRSKEYDAIFKEIRSEQWDTPIAFLGGHTHIRDFKTYDKKAAALESGRYFETIGFLSIEGLSTPKDKDRVSVASPKFSRRYIDNNLFSLHHHTDLNNRTFSTEAGRNISKAIHKARNKLKLDHRRGCAPQTFYVNRAPYPSNTSIFTWLEDAVLPTQLGKDARIEAGKLALAVTNTGAMRFDILKGAFTRDTELLVSPFTSGFHYVADVPWSAASRVLPLLNNEGPVLADMQRAGFGAWLLAPPEQMSGRAGLAPVLPPVLPAGVAGAAAGAQRPLRAAGRDNGGPAISLTPGYTTTDDAGADGDDTLHARVAFYDVPNCIQAAVGFAAGEPPETVDLVYNEFVEPWVLLAMKYLGVEVGEGDVRPWLEGRSFTEVIRSWVEENWAAKGKACP